MDRAQQIFGNEIDSRTYKKALKSKQKYIDRFGDDSGKNYHLKLEDNDSIGDILGIKNLAISDTPLESLPEKAILIGNIRMGFGHYRMSMAMASCAHHLGYTPVWMDLLSFKETTGAKVIAAQNNLYSIGSRLSQKSKLFNRYFWEPTNYETFKRLTYNAVDQKNSELMTPIFNDLDKNIPIICTHVWPAQAAVHAGMKNVVNAIPDDWAMALHYSEGAIHAVQTPNVYLYYKTLSGMDKKRTLKPMPNGSIYNTGHYIDHELVENIESDCEKRIDRLENGKAIRYLLTIGGAGAQKEIFADIIRKLIPEVKNNKAVVYVNIGDYAEVYDWLKDNIKELDELSTLHFNDFKETREFSQNAIDSNDTRGIHIFCHKNIFEAVYSTNILMRSTDLLITKPSELAFYPVPKLFIKRVGKHEMWGAIHSAHIGDGTPECDTIEKISQMLDVLNADKSIMIDMCRNIIKNKNDGIYNGAYEAVKLAVNNRN